jgi:hypothetical protein
MFFRILSRLSFRSLTLRTSSHRGCKSEQLFADRTTHFARAGRPTKALFVKVYGPKEATMTWAEGAAAGVEAEHFQQALQAGSDGEW